MNYPVFVKALVICSAMVIAGCSQNESEQTNQTNETDKNRNGEQSTDASKTPTTKNGWTLYSPPEKDFSVMAPQKVDATTKDTKVGKWREYVFRKGEAYVTVTIHTERKEPLAGNSVEELKSDTSDYLPGSVKDISLGDMPGIEFRMKGAIGESVFREYCASDNSRSISIHVAKDHGGGFTEDEIRLFLDSFKWLK